MDDDLQKFRVVWQDRDTGRYHRDRVLIVPGESSEEDIPVILAVRYFAGRADSRRVAIEHVTPIDENDQPVVTG